MKRCAFALLLASSGCLADLDSFVHNARHCSIVGPETCEEQTDPLRRFCTPCDQPYPWADRGIPAESVVDVEVDLGDGQTNTTHFIPSSGAHPEVTIVYGHGNFGGIEHYLNRIELLYRTGMNLYVVDFRGFGKSSDAQEPSEQELYADALRMRDALDGLDGVGNVLLYGFSVGALTIVEMAAERPSCGLFLEAPWPSAQKFADDSSRVGLPGSFVATGAYDVIGRMKDVEVPVRVVHGTADDFILFEHSQALVAAANDPIELIPVEGANHGNNGRDVPTVMGDEAYRDAVTSFADAAGCSG